MDLFNYSRRKTHEVNVGNTPLGGSNPIRIQSMTNTNTRDTEACVEQSKRIIEAGGEYVRLTTQGVIEAENLKNINAALRKEGIMTPLVADVHFNPRAADVAALYAEKVRINPGNYVDSARTFKHLEYTDEEYAQELQKIANRFIPFLNICKENHTAIRIGVNHGSLSDRIMSRYGDTPEGMVESCMEFLRICVQENFKDVVISIKASNTVVMVRTVRLLVHVMEQEGMDFPLHLGVTEAGDGEDGGEEGLAEGVGAAHDVLQEGFVVDAPHAVEVLRTALGVGLELVLAEVFLVADALAYLVEVHHAVVAAVEESGVVAVAVEHGGDALDAVVAIGAVDEGDVHPGGDAGVDGGDALDGAFAVGTTLIDGAIARQRVEEGGAGVGAGLVVVDAAVFLSEAFHDDEHHVGRQGAEAVGGGVEHGGGCRREGDVLGGEDLVGGALGHVVVRFQLRAHEGADDVVAAVAHQGYVLRLAVAGGVLGLDEGAEASAHEEPHHEQPGAKADQLVGHHGVGVALGEAYAMVDNEEGHDYEDAEDEGVPIVHHEVGYHLVHRAAVAEVGEDFVGEHVVGVLVVGRVGGTCHQKEQHRKHVERLGEDTVPSLPAGFGGQQHQQGEWRQHHADRCQSEHQVAP